MSGFTVTCGVCGRDTSTTDLHVSTDQPIDGALRACGACHESWRELLLELLNVGAHAGRGFITATIAAGRAFIAGRGAAAQLVELEAGTPVRWARKAGSGRDGLETDDELRARLVAEDEAAGRG